MGSPAPRSGDTPIVTTGSGRQTGGMAKLERPRSGTVIAGVCAAIANRFGWNVTLVRFLTVLSILIPGPQVLIYVILWIVFPKEQ